MEKHGEIFVEVIEGSGAAKALGRGRKRTD